MTDLLDNAWQDGSGGTNPRSLRTAAPAPCRATAAHRRRPAHPRRHRHHRGRLRATPARGDPADFVANVSHELKTPMGALGLLAETLIVEPDPAVAQRLASRINTEAFRVSRIIDDLLDLSASSRKRRRPRAGLVNLVMAEAVERVQAAADQRRITIQLDEPVPPVHVLGDRRQLVSAIYSLLENAVTYSYEAASVARRATRSTVRCRLSSPTTGSGIPPATSSASSSASIASITAAAATPAVRPRSVHRPARRQQPSGSRGGRLARGRGLDVHPRPAAPPEYADERGLSKQAVGVGVGA